MEQNVAEKLEFGSPAWIAAGEKFLQAEVSRRGSELEGVKFTASEVFRDAPAHLAHNARGDLKWLIVIDGDRAQWTLGCNISNPDLAVEMSYDQALVVGHTLYDDLVKMLEQPAYTGPTFSISHPVVAEIIYGTHDYIVPRTL